MTQFNILAHNEQHAAQIVAAPDEREAYHPTCPICQELWAGRYEGAKWYCMARREPHVVDTKICSRKLGHKGRHHAINSQRRIVTVWD